LAEAHGLQAKILPHEEGKTQKAHGLRRRKTMSKESKDCGNRENLVALVQTMISNVDRDNRLDELKKLAFKVIDEPSSANKDEMVAAIIVVIFHEAHLPDITEADRKVCFGVKLDHEMRKQYLSVMKELYEKISSTKVVLPVSKMELAGYVFRCWTPDHHSMDYLDIAPYLFSLMIRIYDETEEGKRKPLDDIFKAKLHPMDWRVASDWILEPGLTKGLGNHLAKCRARTGGFELALRDVRNDLFLSHGIDHLSKGALGTIRGVYEDIHKWDHELETLVNELKDAFSNIGYASRIEIEYDYPSKILVVAYIHVPPMQVSVASFNGLTHYVEKTLPNRLRARHEIKRMAERSSPTIAIEVVEQEETIGKFDLQ
jgi:hypothetical protein